jgi:Tol biopolymer transport system component
MKRLSVFFLLLIFALSACKAQMPGKYSSSNKKAIKHYEAALGFYNIRNNQKAKEELEEAIDQDKNFLEAYNMLAYVYVDMNNAEEAIKQLEKSIAINPDFFPNNYFSVANLELSIGRYAESKAHFEKFLSYPKQEPELVKKAEALIRNDEYAIEAIKKPVPFNPINMGRSINSQYLEYFPAITADGNTFLFTRNMPFTDEGGNKYYQEDFFVSNKNNNEWQPSQNLGKTINTTNNEGAPSLSADGEILFFVGCENMFGYGPDRNGLGSCDIFYTRKEGNRWGHPENLNAPVNSGKWETQPSFSSDGRTLYFIRGNGRDINSNDIYKTVVSDEGVWSNPVKLSDKINTPFREESVFIHPDDQTIYFLLKVIQEWADWIFICPEDSPMGSGRKL